MIHSGGFFHMPSSQAPTKTEDVVIENPYLHFIISELWTAAAALTVYTLSHGVAFGIQYVSGILVLKDIDAPGLFLVAVLSWGAAISSGATFAIISIYQIGVLIKRLRRQWASF
jgi:hypothetical protein